MSYSAYPKQSATRWRETGNIPSEWEARRLKFAVTLRNEKIEAEGTDLDYMGLEHIESWTGKRIEDDSASSEGIATRFVKDDVLFGKLRPYLAKVFLAEKEGMATTEALVLVSDAVLVPAFLKYLLISDKLINAVSGTTYGAKMPRANWDAIGGLPILLPSRDEQQKIAGFLDWKTGQIDALMGKKKELLEKLKEKRIAVITQAVTQGLNPAAPMRDSGTPWLGKVPVHWQVMKLHHMVRMRSGSAITSIEMDDDGEYPVFGGNGVRGRFSEFTHEGDYVLIGRQGAECGNINYAHGKFWASEHAVVATPDRELEYRWFGETLRAMNLNQYSQAAAQPGLSVEVIGRLKMPFPPVDEQVAIADFLYAENAKFSLMVEKVTEAIDRLTEYRTALITAATTGKIDVRNVKIPHPAA